MIKDGMEAYLSQRCIRSSQLIKFLVMVDTERLRRDALLDIQTVLVIFVIFQRNVFTDVHHLEFYDRHRSCCTEIQA